MEKKVCTNCGDPKPISDFAKNKNASDGLHSWCRECHRITRNIQRGNPVPQKDSGVIASDEDVLRHVDAECDHGDFTKTKLYQNRHFISGDGGYRQYIASL